MIQTIQEQQNSRLEENDFFRQKQRMSNMMQIKYKNFDKSEMVNDAIQDRIQGLIDKFPDLGKSKIAVTLEMENSPAQAGPDFFKIKLHILKSRYADIIMEKSDPNFYAALAKVADHMLERLNRFGDRGRVKERKKARQIAREVELKLNAKEIEIEEAY